MESWHEAKQKRSLQLGTVLNCDTWRHSLCPTLEVAPVTPKYSGHFLDGEPGVVQYRISFSSTVVTADHRQPKNKGKGKDALSTAKSSPCTMVAVKGQELGQDTN